ncbi:MAG TPA: hypothetical protein VJH24_00390, partial [Candidatus Bilamarchaeaceae archaeon]|nr:hypothetical protein [Candidatus Bilamarchaeaceae archaeon]
MSVRIVNSSNVSFTGVRFENGTTLGAASILAGNDSRGINLSLVNFTNVTGPVFTNGSTGNIVGNIRILNSSSSGQYTVLRVLNGSTLTTAGSSTVATEHMTFTFSNMRNLTVETTFQSSSGVDAQRCGSALFQGCQLVSELIRLQGEGGIATAATLDSLTIYYNSSKLTSGFTATEVYVGLSGDAGWSQLGRTSYDAGANTVTYGPYNSLNSYYGAVGFVQASSSTGTSGSGATDSLTISEPELTCPDNTVTFTAMSGSEAVDGV